jgi:hypothetical protein
MILPAVLLKGRSFEVESAEMDRAPDGLLWEGGLATFVAPEDAPQAVRAGS